MIAVVGGGAAGMAAAVSASRLGAKVVLFEKNEKLGKKIYITGKGRCNVTNACARSEFFENVLRNSKFLYASLSAFDSGSLAEFLGQSGCPVKTERGNRVFPVSDHASDVTKAFAANLKSVSIRLNAPVLGIEKREKGLTVLTREGEFAFDSVILATGGVSYPATGSTGDGYGFAKKLGHSMTELRPALVGMNVTEDVSSLAGLSLKNVTLSVRFASGRGSTGEFGEMLFTHTGISGPIVLTLSSRINRENLSGAKISLDLKPALSAEELDARLLRELSANANKQIKNMLPALLPKSLCPFFLVRLGLDGEKFCNSVTVSERKKIADGLKNFSLGLKSLCGIEGGIVTSGGAEVSQISPKTLESKLVSGLYLSGELLDVDALTGGFNLQIAFSTGWLAGKSAAEREFRSAEV